MGQLLNVPHRPMDGMCPVNGIRDLIQWRSDRDWSNEFLHGLGQGGGFAYLRFNSASPPRQVYWGIATGRQHKYLAGLLRAKYTETENRSFRFSWGKAREVLDRGMPPVIGPLDMFHLHFYEDIYQKRHIPIHYLLLVGCEDETAYVLDTGHDDVQELSLEELRLAWDVNVPGQGKRNRLVVLDIPRDLPPADALIRESVIDECRTMLSPPVSMLGIPAMRKVAQEIAQWPEELGDEMTASCLLQLREYLNSPPDLQGSHLTAGRDVYISFLEEAGAAAGFDFTTAIGRLRDSMTVIPALAAAAHRGDLGEVAACFGHVARAEAEAYAELSRAVGGNGSSLDVS